jgi:parallel beta-helix repeat protein
MGGNGGTWLSLHAGSGLSNIRISGLEITNYQTAISFNGQRENTTQWNGGNIIKDNIFSNIGQISKPDAKPSTAAIRLVNSDHNLITNNRFINIKNNDKCALLHAIYVAHDSTDNIIENNFFKDSCGDAIRLRDSSNNNIIRKNVFQMAWAKSPISEWHCDKKIRTDCTKKTGEYPSISNQVIGNKILGQPPRGD